MLRAAVALLALAAAACSPEDERVERRLLALGTWVDIQIEGTDRAAADEALAATETMLRAFERDYHAWNDGELAAVNDALADGRRRQVSPGLERLLSAAQRLSAQSRGHFDPGIGALVELWGFGTGTDTPPGPPDAARIEAWLARGDSIAALEIADGAVASDSDSLKLDLAGIAKGEAVDRIVGILRQHSVERALINAGGDVRVLGMRAERPWRVGIRAPRGDGLLATLALAPGEAAFTSGDYERFFVHEGRRLHHILDPATGYPATHTQAVTVLADDGVTADAAATALLVAGPEDWLEVAAAMHIDAALRVDASGRVGTTRAMRDRLQTAEGDAFDIMGGSD